jgi:hypothetical protein
MSLVGMAENFQQMLKCDINSARNRLLDSYSTEWYTNLSKFPKLRTYRTFKSSFSTCLHQIDSWNVNCLNINDFYVLLMTVLSIELFVLDIQTIIVLIFHCYSNFRLLDSYSTEWYTNLSKFPKLRTYRTFKSSFSTESYVELNLNAVKDQ